MIQDKHLKSYVKTSWEEIIELSQKCEGKALLLMRFVKFIKIKHAKSLVSLIYCPRIFGYE